MFIGQFQAYMYWARGFLQLGEEMEFDVSYKECLAYLNLAYIEG